MSEHLLTNLNLLKSKQFNFLFIIKFIIKAVYCLMKLSLNKTFIKRMFLLRKKEYIFWNIFSQKNVKYFSSIYILCNKVSLCGGTFNCCWNCFFYILRMTFHIDFKWGSKLSQAENNHNFQWFLTPIYYNEELFYIRARAIYYK